MTLAPPSVADDLVHLSDLPAAPPPGRLRWWREVLLVAAFYAVYSAIRDLHGTQPVSVATAYAHARQIIGFERSIGVFHELAVQRWLIHDRLVIQALDVWYGSTHFLVTGAALLALFFARPQRYRRWRNTLATATALALVGFAVFPLMPPRLLPASYGFTDTLSRIGGLWNFDSGPMSHVSDQFAAMPSLHFAWALWCGLAIGVTVRPRWAKVLAALYPAVTLLCVITTANHFFTDTAAGALTVGVGYLVARLIERAGPRWRVARATRAGSTGPIANREAPGFRPAEPAPSGV